MCDSTVRLTIAFVDEKYTFITNNVRPNTSLGELIALYKSTIVDRFLEEWTNVKESYNSLNEESKTKIKNIYTHEHCLDWLDDVLEQSPEEDRTFFEDEKNWSISLLSDDQPLDHPLPTYQIREDTTLRIRFVLEAWLKDWIRTVNVAYDASP